DRDQKFHDVYRLNLKSGDKKLILKNAEFAGFVIDEDYNIRLAAKYADDGGTVYLQPDGKDGWKEFLKVPMADTLTTAPSAFDKSGKVLYLTDSRDRDTAAFTTLD